MFSLPLSVLEFQRGDRSLEELKAAIEQAVGASLVDAKDLLEQLETTPIGRALDPELRHELTSSILNAEAARLSKPGAARVPVTPGPAGESGGGDTVVVVREQPKVGVGTVLKERFVLEEEIGHGGMSQVYRALDRRREEAGSRELHVALKVMSVQGVDFRQAFVAMQREAQRSQLLNHPGIVRVHDFDQDGAVVYTTMELLSGRPLNRVLREAGGEGLPEERATRYLVRIAEALAYAHGRGIVHADLKPNNVFVTDEDEIKVIDFGIARALPKPGVHEPVHTVFDARRQLGAVTPAYASPEMLADATPDPRDDLYSLGCIAHELYAGRHPFGGVDAVQARASGVVLQRPAQLPARRWPAIVHALAFRRDDRTRDVRSFLEELEAPARGGRSRSVLLGALAGVLAAAVAVAAVLTLRGDDAPLPEFVRDCASCPQLVAVPAGSFTLGLAERDRPADAERGFFETPAVAISLPEPFFAGLHEVTVGEFRAYADAVGGDFGGCRTVESGWRPDAARSWAEPGFSQSDTHPVTCVSWDDARGYVAWLSQRTGERYRLPSEAEWEFLARERAALDAFDGTAADACEAVNLADRDAAARYPELDVAACADGFVHTAPVARSGSRAFSDLLGNVFEWTQDCWQASLEGTPTDGSARSAGACEERVLRGGSWFTAPAQVRATFRNRFGTDYRSNTFGFRVVRELGE